MARTLKELTAELDELLRHVREHGARLQRDIDVLNRRADEKERIDSAEPPPDGENKNPPDAPQVPWRNE